MDKPTTPPDEEPKNGAAPKPWVPAGDSLAADLIRQKVAAIYAEEPSATQEATEAETARPRSKHQEFMHQLSNSGKDLAQIQTEWHDYYISLPENEKQQVWREFYSSRKDNPQFAQATPAKTANAEQKLAANKHEVVKPARSQSKVGSKDRTPAELRSRIRDKVSAGGKLQTKHHLQSLAFGLGLGMIVIVIFLFGFFNEVVIAPFIQPSRQSNATPLIIGTSTPAPTASPEVIIPKINVEIPVDYSQTSTDENTIENALQSGVVHYPTTAMPGQNGNTAYFGHSSNNIFNPGKYKFAFVLLHELVPGDTFYLTKDGKVYVYKVFSKTIVEPSDVGVLNPVQGHTATATLITCDPPGTSLHRLVVVGDQISPDPSGNTQGSNNQTAADTASNLPGNGPTLWGRWWQTGYGKGVTLAIGVLAIAAAARSLKPRNPIGRPV